MVLVAQMGRHNAIVVSQSNLARLARCSVRTLQRALDALRENLWIEVRQIGPNGTSCAYIVNDRIAWSGARDGILGSTAMEPLEKIPAMFQGERQLPTGPGLDPPTQPPLVGLEPDLPTRRGLLEHSK
ncbi:helix-turn-helix domain-containing protein [Acidiphilium sp. 37-64-53]|uniref:helix-turn-helix domain-containing protein n=1 Tax=Acidiphilium sp. 37-64-53 TaxID=1970299 RepID=UPI00257BB94E|nr:helix-turn-helix domain-containing protein [Acidiphilium sp. 37-64-53]